MNRHLKTLVSLVTCLATAGFVAGCEEGDVELPASLQTPRSFTVVRGPVCLGQPELQCPGGTRGAIGLIANQSADSVAVVDLSLSQPDLVDLDPSVPGVTHIPVGRTPVDVAADQGPLAYAVNQADASLTVLNLWRLEESPAAIPAGTIQFDEAPRKAVVTPQLGSDVEDGAGKLLVALTNPSRLWIHDDVGLDLPAGDAPNLPTQADGTEFALPGTVVDIVEGPAGQRAYIVYANRNFASVVALRDSALDTLGGSCLDDAASVPCEAARIGLSIDCSNGVDDDADGLVDQDDPQCYGPRGAESPDGIGRNPLSACSNAMDDDADGLTDREDPDCLVSGQDSEETPLVDTVTLACNDGRDNDGDGLVDAAEDPACYGEVGRTETEVSPLGFAAAEIDPLGNFLYVADRAKDQILVVDATRLELIDTFDAGGRDRSPFASQIGVGIPGSPSAIAARADITDIWTDENNSNHRVVRIDYGAFVASTNGQAYNLATMSTFCEFSGENDEADCFDVPEFPVSYSVEACEALAACQACQSGNGDCEQICADEDQQRDDCYGERVVEQDDVNLVFNPELELRDANGRSSRLRGVGTCETPQEFIEALRAGTEGNIDIGCTSPLRPQPIEPGLEGLTDTQLTETDFERAALIQDSILQILPDPDQPNQVRVQTFLRNDDSAVVEEAWTIGWESIIPGTRRNDALVSTDEPGLIELAGLDVCQAGVEPGDRLTILSEPAGVEGQDLPEECQLQITEEEQLDFRTWEIVEVRANEVVVQVIPDEDREEGENFVDELPTRGCFGEFVTYAIRVDDQWAVIGDRTGFLSNRTNVLGTCQPKYKADHPRFRSRVDTDALFEGPYLSFFLRPGAVPPVRGVEDEFSYRFSVERNYTADRITTTTQLPTQALLSDLPGGRFIIVPDPAQNFVYFRNFRLPSDEGVFLLQ